MRQRKSFFFLLRSDGKNGHDFENYKYILTLNYGENVKQFEIWADMKQPG